MTLRYPAARGRSTQNLLCGLAFVLASPCLSAAPDSIYDAPSPKWRTGPVRYLLTGPEVRAFKALQNDDERMRFVEAFWLRRDPTPETEVNEFRERFEERLQRSVSLRLYMESTKPMWLTDMGKIFILLGPPVREEREAVAASARDTVTWSYDRVPGMSQSHFNIVFVADESGELRISQSPTLDRNPFKGLDPGTPAEFFQVVRTTVGPASDGGRVAAVASTVHGGIANFVDGSATILGVGNLLYDPYLSSIGDASAPGALARTVDLAQLERREIFEEASVTAVSSFNPILVDLHTDFYRAADGTTYTAFTLAPGPDDPAAGKRNLIPFGGIVSLDWPEVTYSLNRADQFASPGGKHASVFQTGLGIDPGRYRVLFGLQDRETGRAGVHQRDITVADLSATPLGLSTITLARSLRPLEKREAPRSDLKVPFILGGLEVIPRTRAEVSNGEEFHVYFQVYGGEDGADGAPIFEITYAFEGKAGGAWMALGKPVTQQGLHRVQAWSFPIRGWPAGTFRFTVKVTDLIGGESVTENLIFEVAL